MTNTELKYLVNVLEGVQVLTSNAEETKPCVPSEFVSKIGELVKEANKNNTVVVDALNPIVNRKLGELFAIRRDRIRWIDEYGFDCASEDITNFFSAYIGLKEEYDEWVAVGSFKGEEEPKTPYKVYLDKTMRKGLVNLTYPNLKKIYNLVRASQYEDYAWLEGKRVELANVTTLAELKAFLQGLDIDLVDMVNGL